MTHSRSHWPGMALTLALAVLFAAFPLQQQVRPAAAQDPVNRVKVVDFAFDPAALTVPAGATVTWTNAGNRPHTVTADDGSFDSGRLDPGEQFSQTVRPARNLRLSLRLSSRHAGDDHRHAPRRRRRPRRRTRSTWPPPSPPRPPATNRRRRLTPPARCAISSPSSPRASPTSTPGPARSLASSSTPFPTSAPIASTRAIRTASGRSS